MTVSVSIISSPVLLEYGSLNPLPRVCSVNISEAEALKGTIVKRLFTSQPSFSLLTWINISVGSI